MTNPIGRRAALLAFLLCAPLAGGACAQPADS